MTDPRYPIGAYVSPASFTAQDRTARIAAIAALPDHLRSAIAGLTEPQIDTPYRDGGWTVRQVIHHLGDSHLVAYTRMKFGLTEESPAVKSYDEQLWAQLPDYTSTPLEVSLTLLEALHARWVRLMEGLSEQQFQRTFRHSSLGDVRLDQQLAHYVWHGRHHVAHITALRDRLGWK